MSGAVYGQQVVRVLSVAPTGDRGSLGTREMSRTGTDVPGCRHRPLRSVGSTGGGLARAEYPEPGVGVATEWWQTTAPPHPAILAAKAADYLEVDGETFKIIGDVMPYTDFTGKVVKVSFLSERQSIT